MAFQLGDQRRVGPAGEHLGDERPAGPQHIDREGEAGLDQPHRPQVVGHLVAHRIRRHVAEDEVGVAAQRRADQVLGIVGEDVLLKDRHAGDRLDRQQIDRDDRRLGPRLQHDLTPAARRRAEVDDADNVPEQAEAFVEFGELERGAAAKAGGLRRLDIGVVQLPFEPAVRRVLALGRGQYADLAALAAPCAAARFDAAGHWRPCRPQAVTGRSAAPSASAAHPRGCRGRRRAGFRSATAP